MTKLGSFNKKKKRENTTSRICMGRVGMLQLLRAKEVIEKNYSDSCTRSTPIARKKTLPLQEPDDSFSAVFELVCLPASEDNQRVSLAKRVCGITDIPCENNEIHQ